MSLKTILEETSAGAVKRFPPEVIAIMQKAAADLDEQGIGDHALSEGATLPSAILTDATGASVNVGELAAKGPLIISFYRGGWCPYCNLELKAYQDILDDIHALGAELVAVTPEKPDNSLTTVEKNALKFPVLTDNKNAFAQALGIVFELPDELKTLYGNFGMDLPSLNADSGWTLPIPATFIVGTGGKILHTHVNRDYRTRFEPSEALEILKSAAVASA